MTRIHLVYPHGNQLATPHAIGRHLAAVLRKRYEVILYDWDETGVIDPDEGDVLVGHPHPAPWTIFRRSLRRSQWGRTIALSPYAHGDLIQMAWADAVIPSVDLFLAITGNHWFQDLNNSPFSHWRPKMVHVDLAVDREEFPPVKRSFKPPGLRKFIYIGHSNWYKNVGYLSEIAGRLRQMHFSWAGTGKSIRDVESLGQIDFSSPSGLKILEEHDFLITVGHADANPTTILEAMAWGLIPVCSPQSGYVGHPGIINIPLKDIETSVSILRDLQHAPEKRLLELQKKNWQELDRHFNWDRFTEQVVRAIESEDSPRLAQTSRHIRWKMRLASLCSPYSPLNPRYLRLLAK